MANTENYNVVLVVGASGNLGSKFAKELLKLKRSEVRVLVRSQNASTGEKQELIQELKQLGAQVVEGDVNSVDSLKKALTGVDAVISAVSGETLGQGQLNLLEAVKQTGTIKRFIPSEFGVDLDRVGKGKFFVLDTKIAFGEKVAQTGIPYTIVSTSIFLTYLISPFMGIDVANAQVQVPGGVGDFKISTTHPDDIAAITARLLYDTRARNAHIQIASDTLTWNELISHLESAYGKKFERKAVSEEQLRQGIKTDANPRNVFSQVLLLESLLGNTENNHAVNREWYPDIKTKKVNEYVHVLAKQPAK